MVTTHQIEKVRLHFFPHLEEWFALWMLYRFGEKHFPGVGSAALEFIPAGPFTPEGVSADELEKLGILHIGCGGGRFDEHPTNGGPRTAGMSAGLVAKELGLTNSKEVGYLLRNLYAGDRRDLTTLSHTVSAIQQASNTPAENVRDWIFLAFDSLHAEQELFSEAMQMFIHKVKFSDGNGNPILLAYGESDNPRFIAAAKYKFMKYEIPLVVLVKNAGGRVGICSSEEDNLDLDELVLWLRLREQELRDGEVRVNDVNLLTSHGTVHQIPEWHYHENMVLNGSLANTSVTPTRISFEEIRRTIRRTVRVRH